MRLNGPWITKALARPAGLGVRALMSTLRYRVWFEDPANDPMRGGGEPRLYLFWHESILLPLHIRGNCNLAMLLSKHADADVLGQIANRFGFDCVRGSTRRGGAQALRELFERSRNQHLTITPDGPRGPRRRMAPGPVYLASKLGMPVVPMGFGYSHPWRMRSWDRFAVPKPFSRARAMIGAEIRVPRNLDRGGLESWRQTIEQRINALTDEAQEWANSGAPREGEQPIRRRRTAPTPPERLASPRSAAA